MDISRITPSVLTEDRLDASYYGTRYLKNEAFLKKCGLPLAPIGTLTDKCNCGATPKEVVYDGMGTGLVRTTDVRPNVFLAEGVLRTSGLRVSPEASVAAVPGDLLYTMSGTIGYAAVVHDGVDVVSFSNTIARARFSSKSGQDPRFTAAFFNCQYGYTQSLRLVSGGIQGHVMPNPFKRLPVPTPNFDAQRYIGDKVRLAERLRERARSLESNVGQIHARYIVPPTGIDFGKRTRRLASRSLTERLDAHFYPSAVEQYFKQSGLGARSLDRLTTVVVNGQSQPEHEGGVPQATVTNLGRSFVEGSLRTVKRPSDVDRALRPHDLLLCNAAHNKTYIGRDVTYSQVDGVYPSTEVMVIRVDRSQLPASYVRQYLKTEIGYLQIQSTIRGITAHSYPGDVKQIEVPVPTVPADEQPAWFATDDMMLAAGRCADAAKVLTGVATQLVEHLIEGKLSEADLSAAQKALESGDRGFDRSILQALRQNGNPAQPLIADLDGLYVLLDDQETNA